jgi:2',3'-cyclic-nucleotide 2'-phosphodiesterase/3'-nucleotidase
MLHTRPWRRTLIPLLTVSALVTLGQAVIPTQASAASPVTFTIMHTNDFHGNLELSGSNPGAARVAAAVQGVRSSVGADKTLLFDAGDMMQGSLLSNLQKGAPTIAYYRTLGYNAATFGNHEFDWGQTTLGDRIAQAAAPASGSESPMSMIVANITAKDAGGACTWTPFNSAVSPYQVFTVGTAGNQVKVGVIGVGSIETPYITIASATAGLCFRDPAESILHYYDELKSQADVMVVLSHNGWTDGGYGYGFTVYGDQTLAKKLNDAGKPVNLIVGGHSHTNIPAPAVVGSTTVVQAYYAGRQVGRADMTFDPDTKAVGINWSKIAVSTTGPQDPTVQSLIASYTSDPTYQALINQPIGYSQVDLLRDYNGDNMMGDFVDDAIYGALNEDATATDDVDMFFNNAGGIRIDWCDKQDPANPGSYIWSSSAADCQKEGVWTHDPMLLTYGNMFQILPFGNATAVGTMTGAQIYDLLDQSATLFKGAIQPSGIRFKFYRYADSLPGPQPYAWGAYDVEVRNRTTHVWEPLDMSKTYKVGTNEFLAPAGQDGYTPFKYMTGITYWGDMLDSVNAYVAAHYTLANPYKGPDGDGTLDGRISRNGNGDDTYDSGEVVPVTILHHNDSHGRLVPVGSFQGYDQLATLIKQERAHNPQRTLVLNAGDTIQGDSMMYYFKSAGLGYAADGTPLPADLQINPLIKAMNAVGYDAMTLGNHEFNFGSGIFKTLAQANFPILGANVADTGAYGLADVGVQPYVTKTVGPEGIKVAILGITNHRVPSYELPSNIPGLTFTNPIDTGKQYAPQLQADDDAVIALTHIGFTEDPKSVEVDSNVDTAFAAQVSGVDAVIGGHSHTNPATGFGAYKYLPAFVAGQGNVPVPVTQAYRYNTNLGEVTLGMLPDGQGGYQVVARSGKYIPVTSSTPEDPDIKALAQPYQTVINAYNNTEIGSTITPIDALKGFTEETNGANLQADASVAKLEGEGIAVDAHLSGVMTNSLIASSATPATPYTLKVSDMFTSMPYENSLVVLNMNGPQLKSVLERAYRNYYYYKYVPGYGGYSYYTTCMLDTDKGNQIVYRDTNPTLPDGNNVAAFTIGGKRVDFTDASTYYRISTVNYLAAGACNFSDAGKSLWPLDQIAADTQYYVRDAVIEYVQHQTGPIAPAVEGRIAFPPIVGTPAVSPEPSYEGHAATASADFVDPAPDSAPYTCTVDYGDGTAPVAGTVNALTCTGPAHTYAHAGSYEVTVAVTDKDGWSLSASTTHAVWFNFTGFFAPLAKQPAVVQAGASVPVKFRLGGYQGMGIFASGYPRAQHVSSTDGSPIGAAIYPLNGKLNYDPSTGTYVYLWKTVKAWRGWSMKLTIKLVDGSTHTALLRFTS